MKIQNLLLTSSLLISTSAFASVLKVTTGEDSVAGSLRAAVASAQPGDTVEIDSKVSRVMIKDGEILLTKSVAITSNARTKEDRPTIDGMGRNRIFLAVGRNLNLEFSNLNFSNANTTSIEVNEEHSQMNVDGRSYYIPQTMGSVLLLVGPRNVVKIHDSEISNNQSLNGAITSSNDPTEQPWTSIVIERTIFKNNSTEYRGGAIYSFWTNLKFNNVIFDSNTAKEGGAVANNAGCMNVKNTTFVNNSAGKSGGAIFNLGSLRMVNNQIKNNTAENAGGIFSGYVLQLSNNTVTENRSSDPHNVNSSDMGDIFDLTSNGGNIIGRMTLDHHAGNKIHFEQTDMVNGLVNPTSLNQDGRFEPGLPPCALEEIK
ncbi:hypothetical protein [Bdellovibrio sp. NC01]|uniref:hypothetical protein n=1 Tax=Bdellovibrio sp. NC01 TaxID=2220073 RepID=UPI00143DAA53|nr:hypothetical protein [Bdellovibrio sp. NC01]